MQLCHLRTERLSNTTIINADATVVAELEEEQVGQADFFIATSTDDEDNVMTCLQAHNIGAKNCLTIIHRADYARAIGSSGRHFGVVAAVSLLLDVVTKAWAEAVMTTRTSAPALTNARSSTALL